MTASRKPANMLSDADQVKIDAAARTAEGKKFQAEARKYLAEESYHQAEARKVNAEAEHVEIEVRALQRAERAELARDRFNHVYVFMEPINQEPVAHCIFRLTEWMRTDPGCDIEIVFNSPCGSIIDGMHLWDFISYLKSKGHKITTVALGYAASMAGILLQSGDVRVIGRESYVLIHEVSDLALGKLSEIEDEMAFLKKFERRVINIFTARSNLTEAAVRKLMHRKESWLDSDECLKLDLVDEVR